VLGNCCAAGDRPHGAGAGGGDPPRGLPPPRDPAFKPPRRALRGRRPHGDGGRDRGL